MRLRTPGDFGALIKAQRKARNLDQADLAAAIGVSRQWVVAIEKGRSGAELGLVLRALNRLKVRLASQDNSPPDPSLRPKVDLDAIISAGRKKA